MFNALFSARWFSCDCAFKLSTSTAGVGEVRFRPAALLGPVRPMQIGRTERPASLWQFRLAAAEGHAGLPRVHGFRERPSDACLTERSLHWELQGGAAGPCDSGLALAGRRLRKGVAPLVHIVCTAAPAFCSLGPRGPRHVELAWPLRRLQRGKLSAFWPATPRKRGQQVAGLG